MDFNYYFDQLQEISALDPDSYFTVTDECLLIRIDHFLSKHHKFDLRELVEDMVSRYSAGRVVYFYFYDGGNPNLSGFKEFIEYLQAQNNLDAERTVVVTYQRTSIPDAVVLYTPISHFLCNTYARISNTEMLVDNFEKPLGCLLGRYDLYRLRLAEHIQTNYQDSAILSCHTQPESLFFLDHPKLYEHYEHTVTWAKTNLPIRPQEFKTTRLGSVNWFDAIDDGRDLYEQFFVDVISETDYNSPDWFTEKTFKPMMLGRPFILWSGPGALHSLYQLGFKTFSGFIDERYDLIYNNQERFSAVLAEVERIAKIPLPELKQIHNDLKPIFEHNRNRMFELWREMDERPWKCWQII